MPSFAESYVNPKLQALCADKKEKIANGFYKGDDLRNQGNAYNIMCASEKEQSDKRNTQCETLQEGYEQGELPLFIEEIFERECHEFTF